MLKHCNKLYKEILLRYRKLFRHIPYSIILSLLFFQIRLLISTFLYEIFSMLNFFLLWLFEYFICFQYHMFYTNILFNFVRWTLLMFLLFLSIISTNLYLLRFIIWWGNTVTFFLLIFVFVWGYFWVGNIWKIFMFALRLNIASLLKTRYHTWWLNRYFIFFKRRIINYALLL